MIQKVLIADDEREILKDFADAFRQNGFEVVTASNEIEFQLVFLRSNPDLVVLDIFFGDAIGPEIYDEVLKLPNAPQVPVVFMTDELQGAKESPLIPGRQVAIYLKPMNPLRIVEDIHVSFGQTLQKSTK